MDVVRVFFGAIASGDQRGDAPIGIVNSQHVRRVTLELFHQGTHAKSQKDGNIQFHQVEHFTNTFMDILSEELSSNSRQLELEQSMYRQNLRKTFEKSIEETSSILDSARKFGRKIKSYIEGSDKLQTSRGLDEDIRSRFVTDNKSSILIDRSIRTFAPNTTYTPSKSPISSRTRSKADARYIKSKGVYSYDTYQNTDIKKEEEKAEKH